MDDTRIPRSPAGSHARKRSIRAGGARRKTERLPALQPGWQPVTYAVLAGGDLAVLATDLDLASEQQRLDAAMRAYPATDHPALRASPSPDRTVLETLVAAARARIWVLGANGWIEGPTVPLETRHLTVDRFSDGRWLLVDRLSRGDNARLLSPAGALFDRFSLGDGADQVAIDDTDHIWVRWSDETLFQGGDRPGVQADEPLPPSCAIARFAYDGTPSFLPAWPEEGVVVVDPYALCVDGRGAWSCPYMTAVEYFPLVRFVPGQPTRWWRNDVKGSAAIAHDGDHVLLAGGWQADRLALLELPGSGDGEYARLLDSWMLPHPQLKPEDAPQPIRPDLLIGRGETIHLVQDGLWYRWRVSDLAPS